MIEYRRAITHIYTHLLVVTVLISLLALLHSAEGKEPELTFMQCGSRQFLECK